MNSGCVCLLCTSRIVALRNGMMVCRFFVYCSLDVFLDIFSLFFCFFFVWLLLLCLIPRYVEITTKSCDFGDNFYDNGKKKLKMFASETFGVTTIAGCYRMEESNETRLVWMSGKCKKE